MGIKVRLDKLVRYWGSSYVIDKTDNYMVKQVKIKPEQRTMLQYHDERDEVWVVVQGHGLAWHVNSFSEIVPESIGPSDTLKVLAGYPHRLENKSPFEDLILIKIQIGEPVEDEDIISVADDWGR